MQTGMARGLYRFWTPPVRIFIGLKETDNEQYPYSKKEKKPSHPTNHIVSRVGLVLEGPPWDVTNQTWSGVQTWIGKNSNKIQT